MSATRSQVIKSLYVILSFMSPPLDPGGPMLQMAYLQDGGRYLSGIGLEHEPAVVPAGLSPWDFGVCPHSKAGPPVTNTRYI